MSTTEAIKTEQFSQVIDVINDSESLLITGTASADGDSVGSQLALYHLIKLLKNQQSKKSKYSIDIINETLAPERYQVLEDTDLIIAFDQVKHAKNQYDVGFVLDGGSERTGVVQPLFANCKSRILVDHHRYGGSADYELELRDPNISSTAEIVFDLFDYARNHHYPDLKLNTAMAAQLYLAVVFDTGFLRYSSTTPKTMRMTAELMDTGIPFTKIADQGVCETSFESKKLLGFALEQMQRSDNGMVAWVVITDDMRKKTNAGLDDHEQIIDHLREIRGVEVACVFVELEAKVTKLSLRSTTFFDVGELARRLNKDGGGHSRAAGAQFDGLEVAEVVSKTVAEINKKLTISGY